MVSSAVQQYNTKQDVKETTRIMEWRNESSVRILTIDNLCLLKSYEALHLIMHPATRFSCARVNKNMFFLMVSISEIWHNFKAFFEAH